MSENYIVKFNGKSYDFLNVGYKLHLPVVPDSNDPLTRKIADYLDKKYGLVTNNKSEYYTDFYKVGKNGELQEGAGITLYGRTSSMQEMKELAEEIEQKFGKELADSVVRHDVKFRDPLKLSESTSVRFALYDHYDYSGMYKHNTPLEQYCMKNKSGALPITTFTRINGEKHTFDSVIRRSDYKALSEIDQKFFHGDSTLYAIDTFGELFTGKCENGKVPQFVMDGLPTEYLEHYKLSEKDIITRINKGTKNIVAAMLKDAVENPDSKILMGKPPWLATLDTKVLDEAKQLLGQTEPETLRKLEQTLPQLTKKCPALAVLEKAKAIPKTQVAKELDFADSVRKLFKNPTVCKTGLCVVGAVALAGVATSIFAQSNNKELLATNKPSKQTNIYGNCFTMSKGNMTV